MGGRDAAGAYPRRDLGIGRKALAGKRLAVSSHGRAVPPPPAERQLEVSRVSPQRPAVHHPGAPQPSDPAAAAPAAALTIDAMGRKCPIPIIMLAERIREVPVGQLVAVLADDPAAETDVPAWCMLKSQEFVMVTALPGSGWSFLVRRCY